MTARVASAPDDVKLRDAQLLRFAPALRVTPSSAAAWCAYAESRAFGAGDSATIIQNGVVTPCARRSTVYPSTKPGQAQTTQQPRNPVTP